MITVKENILTYLLDCGTADLEILEDIGYDIDEIIEELQENDALSLHEIFRVVFRKAGEDLAEALKEQKDDIRSRIEYALEEEQKEYLETGEMTEAELEECEEHISLVNDLKLLNSEELQPESDITYYLNCLDTHVYIEHIDFYRRWMENTIDDIEDKMGFSFGNN